jgi:hypothetical protein
MDTTLAVSEGGVNVVLHKAITLAHAASSDTETWGPFFASYTASLALAGGAATLENAPANKLHLSGVNVSGVIAGSVGFDLDQILSPVCIPPFRVCVHIPGLGRICTPQYCITLPHVDVGLTLPFAFNLDATFGFRVDDLGSQWGIDLLVDPFSPRFDLTPMGPLIISAIQAEVRSRLSIYPVIGSLVAGLINSVIGAFTGFLSLLIGGFGGLINAVLSLLDLFNVSLAFTLLKFDKRQTFIPANVPLSGDAPVNLTLALLTANVLDNELVAEGQLA